MRNKVNRLEEIFMRWSTSRHRQRAAAGKGAWPRAWPAGARRNTPVRHRRNARAMSSAALPRSTIRAGSASAPSSSREFGRIIRIWGQTLVPSAVTATLYFVIFGSLIGKRIGEMGGFDYMQYIAPGLIMMAVITNSYGNVVSSFFGAKFSALEEIWSRRCRTG
jgi:hypothetical protein